MKYFLYTCIVFIIALLQSSLFSAFHFFFPYINILFIVLFAYYISRKSSFALYLFFIGGIFLDFFSAAHIGVTSTNFCIALIIYFFLSQLFPKERLGDIISVSISVLGLYLLLFLSQNFGSAGHISNLLIILPSVVLNSMCILILSTLLEAVKPPKKESKIRI